MKNLLRANFTENCPGMQPLGSGPGMSAPTQPLERGARRCNGWGWRVKLFP